MTNNYINQDEENPLLQEYVARCVREELEKYERFKRTDLIIQDIEELKALHEDLNILKVTRELMTNYFIKEFLTKVKGLQEFKDILIESMKEIQQNQHTRTRRKSNSISNQNLFGLKQNSEEGDLELDVFSMMMVSSVKSMSWVFGFLSFAIQMTLGILVIIDQANKDFFGTMMSIPIKSTVSLWIAQFLAITLSIMTQTDLLVSLRNILILRKDNSWKKLLSDKHGNISFQNEFEDRHNKETKEIKNSSWWIFIFLPNFLKMVQGGLILVASFLIIIQSEKTVDLLKDYSALFVVSSVDNLFFDVADMGYFGTKLSEKAEEVKQKTLEELEANEKEIRKHLMSAFFSVMAVFMGSWIFVIFGQIGGKYATQAYPMCNVSSLDTDKNLTYLSIIGDGICQYRKGDGTNIVECGWDGGDCLVLNERYPSCSVEDFSLLGDGTCQNYSYNSKDCGFDNGDCIDFNERIQSFFLDCEAENIGWIGDEVCNGGDYASTECGNDGGDCADCIVDNMNLIGDGNCDTGSYNTEVCSFDGGDCIESNAIKEKTYVNCDVDHIGWIGDGICNGADYATSECGNDGADCDVCVVDNMSLIGDGNCDGGEYNVEECSFDGGDCVAENEILSKEYPGCVVQNPFWIGDGICNGGDYATSECNQDGRDCADCIVDDMSLIGNGNCDFGEYNVEECSFDGGDCVAENEILSKEYPGCAVQNPFWIGDGICNGGFYATSECNQDGRDCADCIVDDMNLIGDGNCDFGEYNVEECSFDGGDCVAENEILSKEYPGCAVQNPFWIGDGICNGGFYATSECNQDGRDCADCIVDDMNLIGDGNCDFGEYNVEECSFDGGDCVAENEILSKEYPGCAVQNPFWIGDGNCDGREYNVEECSFDGGDCVEKNEILSKEYPGCVVQTPFWIGDGICNGGFYATSECDQDGGDCANCTVPNMNLIGDGNCDFGEYNVEECNFDGGDCVAENKILSKEYPDCVVENPFWIGDGICNGREYATSECGNDSGDCSECLTFDMNLIGNGVCDNNSGYNTKACSFDGGDCDEQNNKLSEIVSKEYPKCLVQNPWWIGNGFCDGGKYASILCGNDGGDCDNCTVPNMELIGDGSCDGAEYNTTECSFDGGDCLPKIFRFGSNGAEISSVVIKSKCRGTREECRNRVAERFSDTLQ